MKLPRLVFCRGGELDDPVVDVGDIHDLEHFVPEELEGAPQDVGGHEGPEVADVGPAVDGGSADVHLQRLSFGRDDLLDPSAQGVVELESSHRALSITAVRSSVKGRPAANSKRD